MARAAVPEASVNKHCDALSRKDDIGTDPQIRRWPSILSKAQPQLMQRRANRHLRSCVARAVALHH